MKATKITLIILLLIGLVYWYSTTDSKLNSINNDIQKNDTIVRKQEAIIAEATKQKQRAEKIKHISEQYLQGMAEINSDVITTADTEKQSAFTGTQPQQAPSTLGFATCITPEGTQTEKEADYKDYKLIDKEVFAGASQTYHNSKEDCLIFPSKEKMDIWFGR